MKRWANVTAVVELIMEVEDALVVTVSKAEYEDALKRVVKSGNWYHASNIHIVHLRDEEKS